MQFELSYHSDCPAGAPVSAQCPGDPRSSGSPLPYTYSTPGQPYSFQIVAAQETFFGTTAAGEDVYEYFVMLQQTWAVTPGAIAWLDVARRPVSSGPRPTTRSGAGMRLQHFGDFAVQTDGDADRQLPLGGNPHVGPWNMLQGKDMAFEVITVPEPLSLLLVTIGLLGVGATRRMPGRYDAAGRGAEAPESRR